MRKLLLDTENAEENRIAVLENGKLTDYLSVVKGQEDHKNSIICGTIEEIEPALNACFVNIGSAKKGFLQFSDIADECLLDKEGNIENRLDKGMKILVQITKDSRGEKGPLLTTRIKLTSHNLVLMPREKEVKQKLSISSKASGPERQRILQVEEQLTPKENYALIVRTNALDQSLDELVWQQKNLIELWNQILKAFESHQHTLIYEYKNIVNICLSEYYTNDTNAIICNKASTLEEVKNTINAIGTNYPETLECVGDNEALFDDNVVKQLDALLARKIQLKSGGELVIDVTEAMVAIDINSKRSRKQENIELTAYKTNIEAATEISSQLKLRNLSGLIVIDFIDMSERNHKEALTNHVYKLFRNDRAQITIGSLSQFGLLEMTRQNIGRALHESYSEVCQHCNGLGRQPLARTIALNILDKINDLCLTRKNISVIYIELPVEPATYLLNEKRNQLISYKENNNIEVVIIPSVNLKGNENNFQINKNPRKSVDMKKYKSNNKSEFKIPGYINDSNSGQTNDAVPAITTQVSRSGKANGGKKKIDGSPPEKKKKLAFITGVFDMFLNKKTDEVSEEKPANKKKRRRNKQYKNKGNRNFDNKPPQHQQRPKFKPRPRPRPASQQQSQNQEVS